MTGISQPVLAYIYNRYGHASATHWAVVELRIAYRNRQKYLSTRINLYPKEWDKKHCRVVNRPDAAILNKTLDKLLNDVRKVIYDMIEEGNIDIFAIPVRLEADKTADITFTEFCEKRTEIRKYGKSTDTQERHNRFMRFLRKYGKIRTFSDITESSVMALDKHLRSKNMKANSRWCNYHRFLNSLILDAQKEGLVKRNPYDTVKIDHGDESDGIYNHLSPEEFKRFCSVVPQKPRNKKIQELFIFACYLCMSYEDLDNFDPNLIIDVNGTKVYDGERNKTHISFTKPILEPALKILEKYNNQLPTYGLRSRKDKKTGKFKKEYAIVSREKYNEGLKELAEQAGIGPSPITGKTLATHWARHTGSTMMLNAGVAIEIVSKIMGHSSTKMTEKYYARMMPETIVNAVNGIADKIIIKD